MREIKFRGKRKNGNDWVYGFLLKTKDRDGGESFWIKEEGDFTPFKENVYRGIADFCDFFEVEPETIGQFTEKPDVDGWEIYEGDIWERDGFIGVVVFEFSHWAIKHLPSSKSIQYSSFYSNAGGGKIISNVHDNPELLNESP